MAEEDVAHELGRLGGTLQALKDAFDEHVREERERAAQWHTMLSDIREETRATNGSVKDLKAWRAVAEPEIALVRKGRLDGAAVAGWRGTLKGRVTVWTTIAGVVFGGVVTTLAGLKSLVGG